VLIHDGKIRCSCHLTASKPNSGFPTPRSIGCSFSTPALFGEMYPQASPVRSPHVINSRIYKSEVKKPGEGHDSAKKVGIKKTPAHLPRFGESFQSYKNKADEDTNNELPPPTRPLGQSAGRGPQPQETRGGFYGADPSSGARFGQTAPHVAATRADPSPASTPYAAARESQFTADTTTPIRTQGGTAAEVGLGTSTPRPPQIANSCWITVFGFKAHEQDTICREFTGMGCNIERVESGGGNFMHLLLGSEAQVQRVLNSCSDGWRWLSYGNTMIGVMPRQVTATPPSTGKRRTLTETEVPPSTHKQAHRIAAQNNAVNRDNSLPAAQKAGTWQRLMEYVFGW
jgi:hypothetical protein